jgi:hypothetical protein
MRNFWLWTLAYVAAAGACISGGAGVVMLYAWLTEPPDTKVVSLVVGVLCGNITYSVGGIWGYMLEEKLGTKKNTWP